MLPKKNNKRLPQYHFNNFNNQRNFFPSLIVSCSLVVSLVLIETYFKKQASLDNSKVFTICAKKVYLNIALYIKKGNKPVIMQQQIFNWTNSLSLIFKKASGILFTENNIHFKGGRRHIKFNFLLFLGKGSIRNPSSFYY